MTYTYTRKAQVLHTEEAYRMFKEVSTKSSKKLRTLIREAVIKVYVEEKAKTKTAEAVDRLLSIPAVPAPGDYQEWESNPSCSGRNQFIYKGYFF